MMPLSQADSKTDPNTGAAIGRKSLAGLQGSLSNKMSRAWLQRTFSLIPCANSSQFCSPRVFLKVVPAMTECWSVDPWAAEAPKKLFFEDLRI